MMGVAAFIMPLLVATSALGSLSCHIMTSSRLCFVGARQGHFPDCLSLVTIDKCLPKPSLIFLVRALHTNNLQHLMVMLINYNRYKIESTKFKRFISFLGNTFDNLSVCWRHLCLDQLCFVCGIELYPFIGFGTSLSTMEKTRYESSN